MKESLRLRLDQLCDRHEELEALLADVEVISDNKRFRNLSREHNDLSEITDVWKKYKQAEEDIETAEAMLTDPDFKDMAVEEIKENKALIEQLEAELNILMIPKIQMMRTLHIWKFVREQVVMKLLFSRVIYSVCIVNMLNHKAGVLKSCLKMKANMVVIKKLFAVEW
jgi:hypothetical protein